MSICFCNYEYRILYLMFVFVIMYCVFVFYLLLLFIEKRLYQVPAVLTAVDDCSPQFAQCGNVQARHIVMSLSSLRSPVGLNSARSFSWRLFKRQRERDRERERERDREKARKVEKSMSVRSGFFILCSRFYLCMFFSS